MTYLQIKLSQSRQEGRGDLRDVCQVHLVAKCVRRNTIPFQLLLFVCVCVRMRVCVLLLNMHIPFLLEHRHIQELLH